MINTRNIKSSGDTASQEVLLLITSAVRTSNLAMTAMITFATDNRFGMAYIGYRRLEGNAAVGTKWHVCSTVCTIYETKLQTDPLLLLVKNLTYRTTLV